MEIRKDDGWTDRKKKYLLKITVWRDGLKRKAFALSQPSSREQKQKDVGEERRKGEKGLLNGSAENKGNIHREHTII